MKRVSSSVLSIVAIMVCMAWGSSLSHAAFLHPGILNTQAEYNLMRSKVLAGAQPWKAAYDAIPSYLDYTPLAPSTITITTTGSTGSMAMLQDGHAAYGSALRWIVSGNTAHANKARQILNAWAMNLKSITGDNQQLLEISWYTPRLAYAAEILKHVPGSDWSASDQTAFRDMVKKFFIPKLQSINTSSSGVTRNNWAALGVNARMAWGVYLDDQALYDSGVKGYKDLVAFYISDFGHDVLDGFTWETCRAGGADGGLSGGDLTHTSMGLAGLAAGAEIAKKQGINLYDFKGADDGFSLRTALLAHGQWWDYPNRSGSTKAGWPCQMAFPGKTYEEGAFPNMS
jgi:Alginate lyase